MMRSDPKHWQSLLALTLLLLIPALCQDMQEELLKESTIEIPLESQIQDNKTTQETCLCNSSDITEDNHVTVGNFNKVQKQFNRLLSHLQIEVIQGLRQLEQKIEQLTIPAISEPVSTVAAGLIPHVTEDNTCGNKCPAGFVGFEGWVSCYKMSLFNTTWSQAKEYCLAFGGHLVAIETTREHYLLTYLIKNNPEYASIDNWWTSGNYINRWPGWLWEYKVKLKEMTFRNWQGDAPNPNSIQCMNMVETTDYKWVASNCDNSYNFICEHKASNE